LNDGVSSDDEIFAREFENMPQIHDRSYSGQKGVQPLYCKLNSGYEIRCGKKYITHQDHQTSYYTKNIETLYKLSFIDVVLPLKIENTSDLIDNNFQNIEVYLAKHLENIFNDACAFLSIVCDREILPIYYDYSIRNQNKYIDGRVIPIWSRRKILKVNKCWFSHETHLMGNIEAFFECCPINKQLSRGIQHLKLTVYESSTELKLMASCSAIEYFYSFWLLEMNGLSKLINIDPIRFKNLKNFKPNHDRTPPLSTVIRYIADDLSIDWNKYMKEVGKPEFLEVRNELLHGSFTSDDIAIFQAEEKAQKLGTEILFAIMKRISKSNDSHLYETLPVRTPEENFYSLSDGWLEVKNILDN
jgi:hypothetical protein